MSCNEKNNEKGLIFTLTKQSSDRYYATITVPKPFVHRFYTEAVLKQKEEIHTYGFSKGTTPLSYVEQNFKTNIIEHLKGFLFHHFVHSYLYENINEHKLVLSNEPQIHAITIEPNESATFSLFLEIVDNSELHEWKNIAFKAPQRKNYKDIDRQVISFIEEESSIAETVSHAIHMGDWICFDLTLLNNQKVPIFDNYKELLWLKIGDEEVDQEIQHNFIGKQVHSEFETQAQVFQEYFSERLDTKYTFLIKIHKIVSHKFFSIERLKNHFNIKTSRDLHKKLIEVFSFRNDISQRQEIIEKLFKVLLPYQKFTFSEALIQQQQKRVLDAIYENPDYYVYKTQKDFEKTVRMLAEKQLKETALIDLVRYQENIKVDLEDVANYLTLIQRARTKKFIYFGFPSAKVRGQEMPITHAFLQHICLREKTLNYIIHLLTRKK